MDFPFESVNDIPKGTLLHLHRKAAVPVGWGFVCWDTWMDENKTYKCKRIVKL